MGQMKGYFVTYCVCPTRTTSFMNKPGNLACFYKQNKRLHKKRLLCLIITHPNAAALLVMTMKLVRQKKNYTLKYQQTAAVIL
jgi:hypothetical protein